MLRDLKFADAVGQDQRGESVLTGSELALACPSASGLASACRSELKWASVSACPSVLESTGALVSKSGSEWELGLESALERL